MFKNIFSAISLITSVIIQTQAQNVTWYSSTESTFWNEKKASLTPKKQENSVKLSLEKRQKIDGFGTCFNEEGYLALEKLSAKDQSDIYSELFSPKGGAKFTICRMPVAANDFATEWYSFNSTPGDFAMKNFSIDHDKTNLIPYIKKAKKYNPNLTLWASPWSPPSWMKTNQHYAGKNYPKHEVISREWGLDFRGLANGYASSVEGGDGKDLFIQDEKYYKAYSLYFSKFIDAYRAQGINIAMVMPQNEFNSAQVFPSCTWKAESLGKFMEYLAPAMAKKGVKTYLGTIERGNYLLADTILSNPKLKGLVTGAGFQWDGKGSVADIHKKYPNLKIYQSEQECGNSENTWQYAEYSFGLMQKYLNGGANVYTYWNTALMANPRSRWGWKQNSLITVDPVARTYKYNYDYYPLKHLTSFVKKGARLIGSESLANTLSFLNPDGSVVLIIYNAETTPKEITYQIKNKTLALNLAAKSFNTLVIASK
jgi:glucosylceramidase